MSAVTPVALFLAGLLGGVHCFGMCGGIVAALGGSVQPGRGGAWQSMPVHMGYHLGRIGSYSLAGAVAGALGGGLVLLGSLPARVALMALSGLLLMGMGAYLTGLPQMLVPLERFGARLWQRIQPYGARVLPVRTPFQALGLGAIWGWLPCGLVYTALTSALASGSAVTGAMLMLAFGLGTLPAMLMAGLAAGRVRSILARPGIRTLAGIVMAAYGAVTLLQAFRMAVDLGAP